MPELGEIKRGSHRSKYIWAACIKCGKERWVRYSVRETKPKSAFCVSCGNKKKGARREAHQNWRGGRKIAQGYITILLPPDDFFYPMAAKNGYVREHRLVMAQHLGRCLQPWEIVHHKNHKKDDNRFENLALATDAGHNQITHMGRILEQQAKEIRLLKWQVKELTKQLQTIYSGQKAVRGK